MGTERPSKDEIFNAAAELGDAESRTAFLDQACAGDLNLKAEIVRLLELDGGDDSLLDVAAPGLVRTEIRPLTESPGTQIGPYKLLQQIGEGGMGVVYMAEQLEPVKRRVALKIIKPGMDTRQVIARFEAERQALSLMDHPNIAKVLDAGTTQSGRPYFVMELVKGQPITQYCDEHQLTPRQRLELLLPVCQAIQHAHQKGIIHRDIKPTNILVAEYDSQPVPKVIDFGVAKATSQSLTEKTMFTGVGQIVGTLEYMSPEQAKVNQLDIDTRSDIYSLGVLLYELLTGSTPFDKERLRSAGWDEMLRIIREEDPPKPSTKLSSSQTLPSVAANRSMEPVRLGRALRGELDWIVMKALEKDRNRRYETATGLANDIQRYLNDEPVAACPPSAAYRFRKFARRNKVAMMTTGLVATALVAGLFGTTWQAIRATVAEGIAIAERDEKDVARREALASAKQARIAAESEQQAKEAERLARNHAEERIYDSQMHWARRAYLDRNLGEMLQQLELSISDLAASEEDRHGFEWFYYRHQANRCIATLPAQSLREVSSDGSLVVCAGAFNRSDIDPTHPVTLGVKDTGPGGEPSLVRGLGILNVNNQKLVGLASLGTGTDDAPAERIECVRISPNGKSLAVLSHAMQLKRVFIRLWELPACREHKVLLDFPLPTVSSDEFRKRRPSWPVQWGDTIEEDHPHNRFGLAFSLDGRWLAACPSIRSVLKPEEIYLWDLEQGTRRSSIHPCGDNPIELPNPKVTVFTNIVEAFYFSPNGKHLATSVRTEAATTNTSELCLWEVDSGECRQRRTLANWNQSALLSFIRSGNVLQACSETGQIAEWDLRLDTIAEREIPFAEAIVPFGRLSIWPSSSGTVSLLDSSNGEQLGKLAAVDLRSSDPIRDAEPAVAFAEKNLTLFTAGADQKLRLWDLTDASLGRDAWESTQVGGDGYSLVSFSPTGERLAVCRDRGTVECLDLATYEYREVWSYGYLGEANAVAFSPTGELLATAGENPATGGFRIDLRNLKSGTVRAFGEHSNPVTNLVFAKNGRYLISADYRAQLQVWDTATGDRLFAKFSDPPERKPALGLWVPGGKIPPSGSLGIVNGNELVWCGNPSRPKHGDTANLEVWNLESPFTKLPSRMADNIAAVIAASSDGTVVAIGDKTTIRIIECASNRTLVELQGHNRFVTGLAFSPDGKRLASTSDDKLVLWNVRTGAALMDLPLDRWATTVIFSADGSLLAIAGAGRLKLYRAPRDTDDSSLITSTRQSSPFLQAEALRRWEQWEAAIPLYERSIQQNPGNDAARLGRARCLAALTKVDEALEEYVAAIDLWKVYGATPQDRISLLNALYDLEREPQTQASTTLRRRILEQQVAVSEIQRDALLQIPASVREVSSFNEPIILMMVQARQQLGEHLITTGETEAGMEQFRKALELCRADWTTLALFPAELTKRLERRRYLRARLGGWMADAGQLSQAAALLQQELQEDAEDALAFETLGRILMAMGRLDEAVSALEKAVHIEPDSVLAVAALADHMLRSGQTSKAIQHLRKLVQLRTDDRKALANLAWLLSTSPNSEDRDPKLALEVAQRAFDLGPTANNMDNLGVAQYRAGEIAAAVKTLEEAKDKRGGHDPEHQFFLAMAYWKNGRKEDAYREYAQANSWLAADKRAAEQSRFAVEAEQVLGIDDSNRPDILQKYQNSDESKVPKAESNPD